MVSRPIGRPRTKTAEERRGELMSAAERLFVEKGFEQTTIEDITSGAAVSKGSFYLHFTSKHDVVEALRLRFVQHMLDRVTEAIDGRPDDDWIGKLRSWASACANAYLDAARLHGLIFSVAPSPPRAGLTRNLLIDHLGKLLEAGQRSGAWNLEDPSFTAIFLFNALHAVVNQDDLASDEPTRNGLLANLEAHFRRIVG